MLTKFFENLGGKLAEQWAATVLTPAFVFWAGGLGAWVWRHGRTPLEAWVRELSGLSTPAQLALLMGALIVVLASAVIEQRCELGVLRLLEGYWGRRLTRLRQWLVLRQNAKLADLDRRFQTLTKKRESGLLTFEEEEEYVETDERLRRTPAHPARRMPTRLGNTLRAAERLPAEKYGLDSVVCWPRLWLLLPDGVKNELSAARAGLDAGARVWFWGMLFLVWTVWAWWAAPVGLVAAFLAYRWMLGAAETYADLLESAFDVHRTALYEALRLPPPAHAGEEVGYGRRLTEYLWRGSDSPALRFTTRNEPGGASAASPWTELRRQIERLWR